MWRKMMRVWLVGSAVTLAAVEAVPSFPARAQMPRIHPPYTRDDGDAAKPASADGTDEEGRLCGLAMMPSGPRRGG